MSHHTPKGPKQPRTLERIEPHPDSSRTLPRPPREAEFADGEQEEPNGNDKETEDEDGPE